MNNEGFEPVSLPDYEETPVSSPDNKKSSIKIVLTLTVLFTVLSLCALLALAYLNKSTSEQAAPKTTSTVKKVEKETPKELKPFAETSTPPSTPEETSQQRVPEDKRMVAPVITQVHLTDPVEARGVITGKFVDADSQQLYYWLAVTLDNKPGVTYRVDLSKSEYDSFVVGERIKVKVAYDDQNHLVIIK